MADISVSALTSSDESAWRNYVNSHPDATIYHTLEWRDIICNEYKFEPVYLIAKTEGTVVGVLPVFFINNLRGKRFMSLLFSSYGGPVCDSEEVLRSLLDAVKAEGAKRGASSISIRAENRLEGFSEAEDYVASALDLRAGLEAIWKGFIHKRRTAIRRGEKFDLVLGWETGEAAVKDFYLLQLMSRKRQGLPTPSLSYYRTIMDSLKGNVFLAIVRKEKVPLAAGLFFKFKGNLLFAQGASDSRYWNYRPNDFLVWEVIKWAVNEGFSHFDFGLTQEEDDSLLMFKKKWGTVSKKWHTWRYPEGIGDRSGLHYEIGSAVFRGLPLPVSSYVGRHVIKWFG